MLYIYIIYSLYRDSLCECFYGAQFHLILYICIIYYSYVDNVKLCYIVRESRVFFESSEVKALTYQRIRDNYRRGIASVALPLYIHILHIHMSYEELYAASFLSCKYTLRIMRARNGKEEGTFPSLSTRMRHVLSASEHHHSNQSQML